MTSAEVREREGPTLRWPAPAIVGVAPAEFLARHRRLFTAVEEMFPVAFVAVDGSELTGVAAAVVGGAPGAAQRLVERGVSCLIAPDRASRPLQTRVRPIRFEVGPAVPVAFRGRHLVEHRSDQEPAVALAPERGDAVLALLGNEPAWTHRTGEEGRGSIDRVALPLPDIGAGRLLADVVNRDRFLGALPLLEFARRACGDRAWTQPAPRACFVFDDPNLRRTRYGCLSFAELAADLAARDYHATLATIPIDAVAARPEAVRILREHRQRLSVVVHGNDHLWLEMAQDCSPLERLARLAQARRRMTALECRHGIDVEAVVESPHGALRGDYLPVMAALGYEAVLVTLRRFSQHNDVTAVQPAFGFTVDAARPGGLALIPRITAGPGWQTEVVLAGYLGGPIVVAGHHFDADGKFALVRDVVDLVDEVGPVTWSSPARIARARYVFRRDGSTLTLRAGARRLVVPLPEGVVTVAVERPWIPEGESEVIRWIADGTPAATREFNGGRTVMVPVAGARTVEIQSLHPHPIDPAGVPAPSAAIWPRVRRAMTEARDRCYPLLPRRWRQPTAGR
jgi:hypothetical protein